MASNDSRSERGALINPRTERVMIFVDPLNIGRKVPHVMTLDLFDLVDTETTAKTILRGKTIETTSTHNDFYGLGTSRGEILEEATKLMATYEGTGIDVIVETTLRTRPVIINTDQEPFYSGSVEVFHLPTYLFLASDTEPYVPVTRTDEVVVIWRNGTITPEGEALEVRLHNIKANDAAGPLRKPYTKG